jgi:putative chitinase
VNPLDSLASVIRAVAPHADAAAWAAALAPAMRSAGIVTPKRVAMFVSQCAAESAGFTVLAENLNYHAERLCAVWPSRFPSVAAAAPFALEPERLACRVYADRMGNGAEESGDGWTFRGAGLIQLTGRANYTLFAKAAGRDLDSCSAWLQTPAGAAASACWFWSTRGLNGFADAWDIEGTTRRINGGVEGLAARQVLAKVALGVFAGGLPGATATA